MMRRKSMSSFDDYRISTSPWRTGRDDITASTSSSSTRSPSIGSDSPRPLTPSSRTSSARTSSSLTKADLPGGVRGSYMVEMSAGQRRIYAGYKLGRDCNCSYVLEGVSVDLATFTAALQMVCDRHEVLRSIYEEDETGAVVQRVRPVGSLLPVVREDKSFSSQEDALAKIRQRAWEPFNFERDSPVRATLYSSSKLLHFCVPHIAIDEWSIDCICIELDAIYYHLQNASSENSCAFVLDPVCQYSEFARANNNQVAAELAGNLEWWQQRILQQHVMPPPMAPISLIKVPPPPADEGHADMFIHKLPVDLVQRFILNTQGVATPFIAWFTLTQLALARVMGRNKFLVETAVTERATMPQFQKTVGFFLSILPFPVSIDMDMTFSELCESVWESYLEILGHAAPYDAMQRRFRSMYGPEVMNRDLNFIFHDKRKKGNDSFTDGSRMLQDANRIDVPYRTIHGHLVIHFDENGEEPEFRLEANIGLLSPAFLRGVLRTLDTILSNLALDGNAVYSKRIGDIGFVSAPDIEKVEAWSTKVTIPQEMNGTWIRMAQHKVRVGSPIPSPRAYVLGASGHPVLPGCLGALHIAGLVPGEGPRDAGRNGSLSRCYDNKGTPFFRHPVYGWSFCTRQLAFYDGNGGIYICTEWDDRVETGRNFARLQSKPEFSFQTSPLEESDECAPNALETLSKTEFEVPEQIRRAQRSTEDEKPKELVHELIERRARDYPLATACQFENTATWTYGEFWSEVERIRALLPDRGGGGAAICLFLGPGMQRIAAILAVLVAGFAYVPLDPDMPTGRNAFITLDCNAIAILSSKETSNIAALETELGSRIEVIMLGSVSRGQIKNKTPSVTPDDLAYILYTSGSTGKPKGVEVTHEALRYSMREHCRMYQLNDQSRLLQISPWTFDASVPDIFGTLLAGGTLCLGRKCYLMGDLAGAIQAMSITHISTTPTVIGLLSPTTAPSLRVLAIGGEPMTESVRNLWAEAATGAVLLNCYGPTEATVDVTFTTVCAGTPTNDIGKPLKDVFAYILDDYLSELPLGGIGQLAFAGPQLARGYRNRPHENTKAFIEHNRFGRIYLTGDLAKMDRSGKITLYGRIDSQIKVRGQRIEPGEIEANMVAAGAVRAVVLLSPDKQSLAAAFSGGEVGRFRTALKKNLPAYCMPRYWISMDIPINQNDKVDRKAVAQHMACLELSQYTAEELLPSPESGVPLSGPKEMLLGAAIQKILNIRCPVYGSSNFFALSGDSMSAIRLAAAAKLEGLCFTVLDIYRNPMIFQLANVARYSEPATSGSVSMEITSKAEAGPIWKIPIVEWFLRSNKKNRHWYNQSYLLKFSSLDLLRKMPDAWRAVVAIHPTLRARCSDAQVTISQPSGADRDFEVIEKKVSEAGGIEELQSCLNVEHGPLSGLGLLQAEDGYYCFITIHHFVVDIVSWRIIFEDLKHFLSGRPLEPEYGSYRQWCERVQQRQNLLNILPPDSEANEQLSEQQNTVAVRARAQFSLEARDTMYLLSAANERFRTEPVDLLLSSLITAYGNWSGKSEDIKICFETHGRDFRDDTVDVTRTVGWFTHLVNLSFIDPTGKLLMDVIKNVKETRARHKKEHDVATSIQPCAPIIFNYSGAAPAQGGADDIFEVVHMASDPGDDDPANVCDTMFDIAADAAADGSMVFTILYSSALYDAADISALIDDWRKALSNVLQATMMA